MTEPACTTVVIVPLRISRASGIDAPTFLRRGPHCLGDNPTEEEKERFNSEECGVVEGGRRSGEWVAQTADLLHSVDRRWHQHIDQGSEPTLIGPWKCTGVEYLRTSPGLHEESSEVDAFVLLHATAETDDPTSANLTLVDAVGKAVGSLTKDQPSDPGDDSASLPASLRAILTAHHHRPEDRLKSVAEVGWSSRSSAETPDLVEQLTAIATHSRDFPVDDPDDHYTQLPARLSPSPSWKLVTARSGIAMGTTPKGDSDGFGRFLPDLARSVYTDVMLLTLMQAHAASSLATDAADMYQDFLGAPRKTATASVTPDGAPAEEKHSSKGLDERIVDLRVGAHRMQPWARGGTFADVHRALQDQFRIPARVAEAEDLTTRVSAAIETRATKRATRTVEFLSALILLPTAIATFSGLWLDHHDTDGTTGFVVTAVVSIIAALGMFAWMYRGWIHRLRPAAAAQVRSHRPSYSSGRAPDVPSSES